MNEMDPREVEIDNLLRRSLSAPVPSLSADFSPRLMAEVSRNAETHDRYRRAMLIGYVVVSALACAVIMRDQGLDWTAIGSLILMPLALVAIAPTLRRALGGRGKQSSAH